MPRSQVSVSQVQEIREEVDNYIENSQVVQLWNHAVCHWSNSAPYHNYQQEPGFYENEYIYDDIEGLEEMLLDVRIFFFYIERECIEIIYTL